MTYEKNITPFSRFFIGVHQIRNPAYRIWNVYTRGDYLRLYIEMGRVEFGIALIDIRSSGVQKKRLWNSGWSHFLLYSLIYLAVLTTYSLIISGFALSALVLAYATKQISPLSLVISFLLPGVWYYSQKNKAYHDHRWQWYAILHLLLTIFTLLNL